MERALDAISHRGLPGLRGWCEINGRMLGHVRLPIQGREEDGAQPIPLGSGAGVFVGEVLNYKELYRDPECDSPYAVSEWLTDSSASRNWEGFWSIATVNSIGTLSAGVDYLAQKPLYWDMSSGVIASELRAILSAAPRPPLNQVFLSNVRKWGYDPQGGTPYMGVFRISPGTNIIFGPRSLEPSISVHDRINVEPWSPFLPMSIREHIERAVQHRLVADVPIGVLCSGGLDSTIVAMLAARTGVPITVFHVENDESEYFDLIRWPHNVEVRYVRLDSVNPLDAMLATEEPVDLGSVVPQYALGKAVHEAGFRVCLTGDGADELFGGYGRAARYDSQSSDVFCELVHYHLPRLDKTMMAHAVELRSPFLSRTVVRRALSVPWERRRSKELLKELFRDIVPAAIIEREKRPLKTRAIREDPEIYRNTLVDDFIQRDQQWRRRHERARH